MVDRERSVESYLTAEVKRLGGWAIKLAPTAVGLPDRLVLLPGGEAHLVELKAVRGHVGRAQRVVHRRLRDLGFPVVVAYTKEDIDLWLGEVKP